MTATSIRMIRWEAWALSEEADRRFRKILVGVAIPAAILCVLLTLYKIEVPEKPPQVFDVKQYVQLEAEQKPAAQPEAKKNEEAPKKQEEAPKPKPEPPKPEKPRPEPPKPVEPKPEPPKPDYRQIAKNTKEMQAIQNELADLRDQSLNVNNGPLVSGVIASKVGIGSSAESIGSSAANTSGGIGSAGGSVSSGGGGVGLGERHTGRVSSGISNGAGRHGDSSDANARSLAEIQEVFDRNQQHFYSIYNRASRDNPSIDTGKIVIRITIAPDGSVTDCSIVSSSFNAPDFEQKILDRVRLLHFSAKNVPPFTYPDYPISFHPM